MNRAAADPTCLPCSQCFPGKPPRSGQSLSSAGPRGLAASKHGNKEWGRSEVLFSGPLGLASALLFVSTRLGPVRLQTGPATLPQSPDGPVDGSGLLAFSEHKPPQKGRGSNNNHPSLRWPWGSQVIPGHLLTLGLAQEALSLTHQGSREGQESWEKQESPVTRACFPAGKRLSLEVGSGQGTLGPYSGLWGIFPSWKPVWAE